ncbi:MAG: class I SAM-dependent methyltransferase [Verrucomicrobia bacterium]|nr:class I SAM-dependent methyltransferase [Verrucomicrobiota bacterium]
MDFLEKVAAAELPIGNVGPANLCFLAAVASTIGATRMLEIGTASGATSALLAAIAASTLAEQNLPPAGILLTTIDKKSRCLFDDSKPIGFMIADLAPTLAPHIAIHTEQDSYLARTVVQPGSLDLAFIDGNHQHPWPLIDVLNILPLMRPGAWLIFHDTDLPAIATQLGVPQRYGAQWLFESWPGHKLSSDNIGAVALPQDLRTLRAFLEAISMRPFEVSESGWNRYRKMLADSFSYAFQ